MANKTATFSGPRKSGSGNVVRGVPPPDPPYGPILAIYRPQKCRFGGPGPGARFGRGPEFPETFPGPPGPRKFSPPRGAPPGPPSGGVPGGSVWGPGWGLGPGYPRTPVSGVWDPHLDRGPRTGVPASSIGVGTRYGGTPPKPPESCLRHQGGQSPLDHPRAAELPDPDRARGAGPERAHVMSGPEGRWQKDRPLMTADQSRTRRESGVPPGPGRRPAPPGPGAPPPGLAGVLDRASARKAP